MSFIPYVDFVRSKDNTKDIILDSSNGAHNLLTDCKLNFPHTPESVEVITFVPDDDPPTYAYDALTHPMFRHKLKPNENNNDANSMDSKALIQSLANEENRKAAIEKSIDLKRVNYADMLDVGNDLKQLTPVFNSIKSIVTHFKKTISEMTLPHGLAFITDPLNQLLNNISDRFNYAFGPINPFLKDSFVHTKSFYSGLNRLKMQELKAQINADLLNRYDFDRDISNVISETASPWRIVEDIDYTNDFSKIGTQLHNLFEVLRSKSELNKSFIEELGTHSYQINGVKLPHDQDSEVILKKFKQLIPDPEFQQLISAYAHESLFTPMYFKLMKRYPQLLSAQKYFEEPKISYNINKLDNGAFKLTATKLIELSTKAQNDAFSKSYHSFGIRSSVIFSKNEQPAMQHSIFVK